MIRKGLAVAATALFWPAQQARSSSRRRRRTAASPDFSKVEIKTTELGDNVYMLEGQGGNITVAVAKTGIIMVDGQFAPLHDKIKAAIANISSLPIKYLINTHYHGDHTGGNELFAKDGGAGRGADQCEEAARSRHHQRPHRRQDATGAAGALPGDTYTNFSKIRLPGRVADLKNIPNAHTDGDTYVWFKTANVLATGDTFTNGRYPNIRFSSHHPHPGDEILKGIASMPRSCDECNAMFGLNCDWRSIVIEVSLRRFPGMSSACCASRMRPTAMVFTPASLRTRSANGPEIRGCAAPGLVAAPAMPPRSSRSCSRPAPSVRAQRRPARRCSSLPRRRRRRHGRTAASRPGFRDAPPP